MEVKPGGLNGKEYNGARDSNEMVKFYTLGTGAAGSMHSTHAVSAARAPHASRFGVASGACRVGGPLVSVRPSCVAGSRFPCPDDAGVRFRLGFRHGQV